MTPEEARARAKKIFAAQKQGQVIKLDQSGNPVPATEPDSYGKRTVLYDRKGEFARNLFNYFDWPDELNFEQGSPEFRMGSVRDNLHRHQLEREKLASAWNAIEINPPWFGIITAIGGAAQPIP